MTNHILYHLNTDHENIHRKNDGKRTRTISTSRMRKNSLDFQRCRPDVEREANLHICSVLSLENTVMRMLKISMTYINNNMYSM